MLDYSYKYIRDPGAFLDKVTPDIDGFINELM